MSLRLKKAIRTWLRSEQAGEDRRAERALSRVFDRLPYEAPSAAFVGRVLAGAGFHVPLAEQRDLRGLRWRLLAAACLILAASASTYLPAVAQAAWLGIRSGKLLELGIAGLVAVIEGLTEAFAVVRSLGGALQTVGAAFASPLVLAMIATSALMSLLAFRWLQGLMVSQRSTQHV